MAVQTPEEGKTAEREGDGSEGRDGTEGRSKQSEEEEKEDVNKEEGRRSGEPEERSLPVDERLHAPGEEGQA